MTPKRPPMTINQAAAMRRLQQLKLLVKTDYAVSQSAEQFRVSNATVFKYNLFDLALYVMCVSVYLVCHMLASRWTFVPHSMLYLGLFCALNQHLEAYRSFVRVRRAVKLFEKNDHLRRAFLETQLGTDPGRRVVLDQRLSSELRHIAAGKSRPDAKPVAVGAQAVKLLEEEHSRAESNQLSLSPSGSSKSKQSVHLNLDQPGENPCALLREDSFRWLNKIIVFLWPVVSQVIHVELNDFFKSEIESGHWARSRDGSKRLLYSILNQLTNRIVAIERCQLGRQTPKIKQLELVDDDTQLDVARDELDAGIGASRVRSDSNMRRQRSFKFNIELEYEGDMNLTVIYRNMGCMSSRIGLSDVFLRLKMQVELGPTMDEVPFIEAVSFSMLELPAYGYRGIELVELAELKMARALINSLVKHHLLAPERVTLDVAKIVHDMQNREPAEKRDSRGEDEEGGPTDVADVPADARVPWYTTSAARMLLCCVWGVNGCFKSCQCLRGRPPRRRSKGA